MEVAGVLLLGIIALAVLLIAASGFRIVRPYEQGLIEFLGKYQRTVSPGLRFVVPFVQRILKVDMREQVVDVPPQEVITKDNVVVTVDAVIYTIQSGVPVARVELLDDVQMDAVNRYSDFDYAVRPTLFFEFHGTAAGVEEQSTEVGLIAKELGGTDFEWATRAEERSRLWAARHEAYYASLALRPGSRGWATDVCVPISSLADCLLKTREDIDAEGLLAPIVAHAGDGNFHVLFIIDPDDEEEMARAKRVNARMIEQAISVGGTCTGEHGVGYGKVPYMRAQHGDAVDAMRSIKEALDPKGLMNPGKVVA